VLGILVNPGFVLFSSELSLGGEGTFVVFNILCNNSNFLFGFSEGIGGVFSQFGESNNLSLVVSNSLFEVINELFAGSLVVIVD